MNYQEIKNNLKNSVLEHIKNDLETIENELNNIQKILTSDKEINIKSIAGKKGRIKGLITRKIEFYLKLELIKQIFKAKSINSTYTLATLILNEIGVKTKISNITYYKYFKNDKENPKGRNKAFFIIKEKFNKEEILEIKEIYNNLLEELKNNLEVKVNIEKQN